MGISNMPNQAVPQLSEDCLLAGRYQILEKLGEGGMGAVYKAHDMRLDRDVAVKVLPPHSLHDADALTRFQRECRALAKLSHTNIIQAYDNGEDQGRHFLVMEYVAGVSLAAILQQQGAVPPTLAADMICQAAVGLQHAHEKGLVHRDLKPANLLLSPAQALSGRAAPAATELPSLDSQATTNYTAPPLGKGIVKILDLGLARFLHDQVGDSQVTQEGAGVGTPDYMAPEQFRDALHADARTDIYGLGCTLYQLIGGSVPFPGSSFSEKASAHAKKEPVPLEERCPEVPAGLAFVVSKMMAKHPADRYQTAAEVAEALGPYVAGASHSMIMVRQTMRFGPGQLTVRDRKRGQRTLALGGGAIVGAVLVGLFVFAWPIIFPRGRGEPKDNSQAQSPGPVPDRDKRTTEPDEPAEPVKPAEPNVVTIENGLTVAQDGTGQYKTIGEALDNVKPGQTIRVLDDEVYREMIRLAQASRFSHITIEAPRAATLSAMDGNNTIVVIDVPGVTIRGFKIRSRGPNASVAVAGKSSGTVFQQLQIDSNFGVVLLGVVGRDEDPPVIVQDCNFQIRGDQGIRISGLADDFKSPRLCRRVLVRGNLVQGARYGVVIHGQAQQVQVVGNRITGADSSGIGLIDLLPGTQEILIANNTLWENHRGFTLFDDPTKQLPREGIAVKNNLVVKSQNRDFAFFDGIDPDNPNGAGDGALLPTIWQFSHNWREGKSPGPGDGLRRAWIPPSSSDVLREQIPLPSAEPKDPTFLRPAKDSPLVTGGDGGDLPRYVGAVPPAGVEPWDWRKTWESRHPKMLFTVSKDPQHNADCETIGEALKKARPKSTIRVLDAGAYEESIIIDNPAQHAGITLESTARAVLKRPKAAARLLLLGGVAGVNIKGFRLVGDLEAGARTPLIMVTADCAGSVLEDLELRAGEGGTGIMVREVSLMPEDKPFIIRDCRFEGGYNGIALSGTDSPTGAPCRGVAIRNNRIADAKGTGILMMGAFGSTHLTGNIMRNCRIVGIELVDLVATSRGIVLANNAIFDCECNVRIWDNPPHDEVESGQVELRNNLIFDAGVCDIGYLVAQGTSGEVSRARGADLARLWHFGQNRRDLSGTAAYVPLAETDQKLEKLDLLSRDPTDANFLRPKPGSSLATGGAGKDLPPYIGPVAPEGATPWDWEKTWNARVGTVAQQEDKPDRH